MKNLIKLAGSVLILVSKSNYALDGEAKIKSENIQIRSEFSVKKLTSINAYRSNRLIESGLYKVLSNLVEQYDPIEDKWECEKEIKGFDCPIYSVCLLPGNKIAAGSYGIIKVLDIDSDSEIILRGHECSVNAFCPLPNNKLASASDDDTIKIWNLNTGECEKTLTGHTDSVHSICLLGGKLISASCDKKIKIWNIKTGKCTETIECESCVMIPFQKNKLILGFQNGSIKILNLNTCKYEKDIQAHAQGIRSLCLLPGNKLASGSVDQIIKVWDLCTDNCEMTLKGHVGSVRKICFLPENKLASGSFDKTIKIWDLKTGLCEYTLDDYKKDIWSICLLDGNKIVSGSSDKTVKIWSNPVFSLKVPTK